jgi:hypothetical protein
MGIHRGPNPVNDGLVVGYDTGYGVADNSTATRFYPGAPTTNIVPLSLSNSSWFNEYSSGRTLRSETLFGQPVYEFKSNDGQIWISPFAFNSYDRSTNDLTLSVYAKNIGSSAASIGNYFGGDYSSDSLGNGNSKSLPADNTWRRYSWTRFSSAMAANYLEFRTANAGVVISCPQLEIGRLVTPVVSGTRSSTASLIDLKKTTDIDVSNVSFDSTGQPTFDGTSDYITIPGSSGITSNAKTVEIMFKMNGSYPNFSPLAIYSNGSSATDRIWLGMQNSKFRMHGWGTDDPEGTTIIAADTWYVCVFSYDKTSQAMKVYTNGVLETSTTNTQGGVTAQNTHNWSIGTVPGGWQSVTYSDADIPIFKVYNRILSDSEVKQNYNAYKNRFDI